MTKNEIEEISLKITEEINNTKKRILDYKELNKPVAPDSAIGRVSRMDAINNKSITEAALKQAEKKLKGLLNMKEKMSHDDFGLCQKCKQAIPIQRMLFIPQSGLCVNCTQ